MADFQFELKGWHGIIAIVVLALIIVARLVTFSDLRTDDELMQDLQFQLLSDYLPDEADKLQAAVDSKDRELISKAAEAITSARLNIESVKGSSPLFSISSPKDVVIKVTYSLVDSAGPRDRRTVYYLYKQGGLINTWQYRYQTGKLKYYMNFM